MSVRVTVDLNGVPVALQLDDNALATIAAALPQNGTEPGPASPYMTIPEAADYLRCSRQRIDDLLSQRRLTRTKDGTRTLILRSEIDAYLLRPPSRRPR